MHGSSRRRAQQESLLPYESGVSAGAAPLLPGSGGRKVVLAALSGAVPAGHHLLAIIHSSVKVH